MPSPQKALSLTSRISLSDKLTNHMINLISFIQPTRDSTNNIAAYTMQTDWKKFLIQQGAELSMHNNVACVAAFKSDQDINSLSTQTNIICDLSHTGLMQVDGEDKEKFLQGQLTCDVTEVTTAQSRLGAMCTPKGRMLSSFRAIKNINNTLLLSMPQPLVGSTIKALDKFIVFFKANTSDVSDDYVHLGLSGPNATAFIEQQLSISAPSTIDDCVSTDLATVIRVPGTEPRYEIHLSCELAVSLWQNSQPQFQEKPFNQWILLDIENGLASVQPESIDHFIPQELNFQAINAINFKKGCYTGQEIVARMQYLGSLKKASYRIHCQCEHQPKPCDKILNSDGKNVGEVVISTKTNNGYEALALIRHDATEQSGLTLSEDNSSIIELSSLPYTINK